MTGEAKAFEDALVFGLQRIEACADHPCNGLLKRLAETAGVQFRDKELGDVLGQVHLSVAPAGHVQFGQWISSHVSKA